MIKIFLTFKLFVIFQSHFKSEQVLVTHKTIGTAALQVSKLTSLLIHATLIPVWYLKLNQIPCKRK